jgi:hypothetical protein
MSNTGYMFCHVVNDITRSTLHESMKYYVISFIYKNVFCVNNSEIFVKIM